MIRDSFPYFLPILSILFFLSCSKGEKNDFDKNIKYAVDYGFDPATGDTIYMFAIPNGFSPNADGINDVFHVQGFGIDDNSFTMKIFARNGNFIFFYNDLRNGWDGTIQGRADISPMGLYNVDISLTDTLGISHRYLYCIQMSK